MVVTDLPGILRGMDGRKVRDFRGNAISVGPILRHQKKKESS